MHLDLIEETKFRELIVKRHLDLDKAILDQYKQVNLPIREDPVYPQPHKPTILHFTEKVQRRLSKQSILLNP